MELKNILNELLLNKSPRTSHVIFEILVLDLLSQVNKDSNKNFITNYIIRNSNDNRIYEFDAYAPDGFINYEGTTLFELKFIRNKRYLIKSLNDAYFYLINSAKTLSIEVKNIIFIVANEITEDEKLKIIDSLNVDNNYTIDVWDLNYLQQLADSYPATVNKTVKHISELLLNKQVEQGINSEPELIENQRDTHIYNLRKCFSNDDLVLFLGAGVSRDAQIPMWDTLVSDLLVSLLSNKLNDFNVNLSEEEKNLIIENIKKSNGNSPLLMARYIRQGLQDIFNETLSKILYKSCVNQSSILNSITRLCKPIRNGIGIRGVVNYNFDDLIEFNFKDNDINHRAIFREGDIPSRDELGVYHVHGFLPRDIENYSDLTKSLLVFSEEGYHELMLDPYNWANLIQLNYLRENTCLFIGLSLTDPNLRRLLDIASRKQENENTKHYAILKKELFHSKVNNKNINLDNIKIFDTVNQKLQEDYYKELGLNVIWVDDHNEIPAILDRIRY